MISTHPQALLRQAIILAVFFSTVLASHHSFASAPLSTQAKTRSTSGSVQETMNSGGYTYLLVDSGLQKTWVAIPETAVKTGEKVQYKEGKTMVNFHSTSLNRTFATIVFSPGLRGEPEPTGKGPQAQMPQDQSFATAVKAETETKPAPDKEMASSGGSTGAVAPFSEIKVDKAQGENSYTVAEIFARAKELDSKTVRLRAKIVKVNPNIMGRNWIHLQDGTGNPLTNSHDLVVTTSLNLVQDQVVTIEGKVAANKDFGAGYSYTAIIEDAQILP